MENRIRIGFGIPQGGILTVGGITIVDFEIFMRMGLPSFKDKENGRPSSRSFDLFKPWDYVPPNPKMKKKLGDNSQMVGENSTNYKLSLGFFEGVFT